MTLHATARAKAIVHTAAIVGVLAVTGTGFLVVDKMGEARRCHHLTSKAALARYECPTTSGVVVTGEGTVTPEATPTPRVMAPRRAPVASRTRRLDPSSSGSLLNWHALAECESGNDPKAVNASGKYRGAFQFDLPTWANYGPAGDPAAASYGEQLRRAQALYADRGRSPWPYCGRFL